MSGRTHKKWNVIELNDEYFLAYSKQGDSLPITTFGVDIDKPCIISSYQVSSHYNDLELNTATECPFEVVT